MKRTARISISSLAAVAMLTLGACAHVAVQSGGDTGSTTAQQQIAAAMQQSAAAWNRGDLDGFLAVYKDDPHTAFMAPQITYGLSDIKARYTRSYFKDGKPKAQLTYDDLKFRQLGPNYELLTGRWHLTDKETGKKQDGYYSLIWERTSQGWRIIHDHSS